MERKNTKKILAGVLIAGLFCTSFSDGYGVNAQNSVIEESGNDVTETTGAGVKADALYNPVYNPKKNRMEFSYIYFGSYPQSEVMGEALTEEIINAEYVSGEAVVEGIKYCRMKEEDAYYSFEQWKLDNEKNLSEENKDSLENYRQYYYSWGSSEEYHYFKYEPIRWRVIEKTDGKALLLADSVLDHQAYHAGNRNQRFEWKNSEICAWLNDYNDDNGFMSVAFTDEEIQMLCDTFTGDQYESEIECPDKKDKVFVMDSYQLTTRGIEESIDLQMKMSDYTFARGLYNIGNQSGNWWLRDILLQGVEYVDYEGNLHCSNWVGYGNILDYRAYPSDMTIGVCPAITLDLSNEELWQAEMPLTKEEVEYLESLPKETPKQSAQPMKPSELPEISTMPSVESDNPLPSDELISSEDVLTTTLPMISSTSPVVTMPPVVSEAPTTTPSTASNEPVMMVNGDTDGDGVVDLNDAQLALKAALKIEVLSSPAIVRADVVKDGLITLEDARKILKMALKIE